MLSSKSMEQGWLWVDVLKLPPSRALHISPETRKSILEKGVFIRVADYSENQDIIVDAFLPMTLSDNQLTIFTPNQSRTFIPNLCLKKIRVQVKECCPKVKLRCPK